MKDLYEIPDVILHLKDKKEYDEYIEMLKKVEWHYLDASRTTPLFPSIHHGHGYFNYVAIKDCSVFGPIEYFENTLSRFKVIALDELKEILKDGSDVNGITTNNSEDIAGSDDFKVEDILINEYFYHKLKILYELSIFGEVGYVVGTVGANRFGNFSQYTKRELIAAGWKIKS